MPSKSKRVLISLPISFLRQVDKCCEEEQRTRSELIREALRAYMWKERDTTCEHNCIAWPESVCDDCGVKVEFED